MLFDPTRRTLPPSRRIRQRTEFEKAFRANYLTNKWFMVYARDNGIGYSRLGLVISKRTMPKAVARNFAKRLVREVFRFYFPVECALDIVVRARRQIGPANSVKGRQALVELLKAMQT